QRARAYARKIQFCYTPKHGSWLNIAENELSALTRQCLHNRRLGEIHILREEVGAWSQDLNSAQKGVDWQMRIENARKKLKSVYPQIKYSRSTSLTSMPCAVKEILESALAGAHGGYVRETFQKERAVLAKLDH